MNSKPSSCANGKPCGRLTPQPAQKRSNLGRAAWFRCLHALHLQLMCARWLHSDVACRPDFNYMCSCGLGSGMQGSSTHSAGQPTIVRRLPIALDSCALPTPASTAQRHAGRPGCLGRPSSRRGAGPLPTSTPAMQEASAAVRGVSWKKGNLGGGRAGQQCPAPPATGRRRSASFMPASTSHLE